MSRHRFPAMDYFSRLRRDETHRDVGERNWMARGSFERRLSLQETIARASTYLFGMAALWGLTYLCLAASELLRS